MNEEITLKLETFNDKEYILADDCIKAIGIHRKTNTKLHKEIERLKEELNDEIDDELKQSEIMVKQQNEIERLKDLCNKYEEEHKTTYEIWKKDIYLYNSLVDRIDKAIEYIEEVKDMYTVNEVVNQAGIPILDISIEIWKKELLDILKGSDKE